MAHLKHNAFCFAAASLCLYIPSCCIEIPFLRVHEQVQAHHVRTAQLHAAPSSKAIGASIAAFATQAQASMIVMVSAGRCPQLGEPLSLLGPLQGPGGHGGDLVLPKGAVYGLHAGLG